jgi:type IV fimbrial biogenesis protein FimT
MLGLNLNNDIIPFIKLNQSSGFSLVEVITTISIVGILLSISVPMFNDMISNMRLLTETNTFLNSFNYARSNALSQSTPTKMCPFDGIGLTSCGNDWSKGWIVVSTTSAGVDSLIQSHTSGPRDPQKSTTSTEVTFTSRGIATTQSNFSICDNRGLAYARSLQVSAIGYTQIGATPGTAVWGGSIVCP